MIDTRRVVGVSLLCLAAACTVGTGEETDSADLAQARENCGNGKRDPGEQCDDGNASNLDGCSASCQFEQTHRLTAIEMMFGTDAYCTKNAIGGAIKGVAQGQIQNALTDNVNNGNVNLFLAFAKLEDLSGGGSGSVTLGSFVGKPVNGIGLDALFTATKSSVKPDLTPGVTFDGNVASRGLTAGPGNFAFSLAFGDAPADVNLSNTRARATLGAASKPGNHPASENVDPALATFATTTAGQLCGNVSAASLAAIPAPDMLTSGSFKCTQGYSASNSMLDVIAGGCKVLFATALSPTQPDEVDPTAPAAGAGGGYTLQVGANKAVNGCKDRSGASVNLNTCLKAAAYSAAFKFTSQRAIVRGLTR